MLNWRQGQIYLIPIETDDDKEDDDESEEKDDGGSVYETETETTASEMESDVDNTR